MLIVYIEIEFNFSDNFYFRFVVIPNEDYMAK